MRYFHHTQNRFAVKEKAMKSYFCNMTAIDISLDQSHLYYHHKVESANLSPKPQNNKPTKATVTADSL